MFKQQFLPEFDYAPPERVDVRYVICSTPRSGSHFLGHLLYGEGCFGYPLEYFNRKNVRQWEARQRAADFDELVPFLESIRTSPNGCFGMKVHFDQLETALKYIPLENFRSRYRFIRIVREDLLAQAISLSRAQQTGAWFSWQTPRRELRYDGKQIERLVARLALMNASWSVFLSTSQINALSVRYETLVADAESVLEDIAEFLGVTRQPSGVRPPTGRQADIRSESWSRRFLSEPRRPERLLETVMVDLAVRRAGTRQLLRQLVARLRKRFFGARR